MNEKWTVNDIPDQSGKVVIVTGANSGIGLETAKELARKGAHIILACRTRAKAEDAAARIRAEVPDAQLEPVALDLGSLRSVRAFAEAVKAGHDRLDVLVNNAGIMWVPYGKTEDGFEQHFGVNHLGHFALTGLLIDLLTKTPGARSVDSDLPVADWRTRFQSPPLVSALRIDIPVLNPAPAGADLLRLQRLAGDGEW